MPFLSSAQERYMFAKHPQIARRWVREQGQPATLKTPNPLSADSPKPARSDQTDFKRLVPNQLARHVPAKASEKEAMAEGHGTEYQHGSKPGRLGRPETLEGYGKRDALAATRRLPGVKNP